ncbi:MAG: glycosyltransferase family 9 protein [Candidatus Dadabacteria bacterium]|nr:glycosyltransferase family 9 protein [Candidatus Dadabacteria bacterium]
MFSKLKLLKLFDKLLGTIFSKLVKFFVRPNKISNNQHSKFLIIRPGGIGDAVLLFPAIEILKTNYPNSQIDILAEKRNAGVFKFCSKISNLFVYDSLNFLKIFKTSYDVVIDTEQWHKLSSVVGYLTKSPVRIGFNTNNRSDLHTASVDYDQNDYEAESFINLIENICDVVEDFNPDKQFIFLNDTENYSDQFNSLNNISDINVGIFFGATVDERKWGIQNFSDLEKKLIEKGFKVIVLGGESDKKDMVEFKKNINSKSEILDFVGKTSLKETAYIISKLDLLVSGDSGLMHLAYGLGTKTLSLFGAGIEEKWAPKGINNHIINKNISCSPCTSFGYTPKCPYKIRCLSEISVDEVFSKTLNILNSNN